MFRRESLLPVVLAGLSLIFILVSAAVYLSRGHAFFIRQKLRTGALILSLTATLTGTQGCDERGLVSCYEPGLPPPRESIEFTDVDFDGWTIVMTPTAQNVLAGVVLLRVGDAFSYRLQAAGPEPIQSGDIEALDGAFDEVEEAFEIIIDPDLTAGLYELQIYPCAVADIDAETTPYAFQLNLIEATP